MLVKGRKPRELSFYKKNKIAFFAGWGGEARQPLIWFMRNLPNAQH